MWTRVAGIGVGLVLGAAGSAVADEGGPGFVLRDPAIVESSGLAASRTHPGVYWTHNDSANQAQLFAVDGETGHTLATVTLTGVEGRDLEAVSVGPDGDLYVGDIGDNLGGTWPHVWIYRFAEPEQLADTTIEPEVHTVRYADGARDAESLAVHPLTGRVYIVGKTEGGDGLYAGPQSLSADGVNTFERVADIGLWATDAAFSPDGTRLAVRSYFGALMYAWEDGAPERLGRLPVPIQQQGEAITFTPDGRHLLYGSEGAGTEVVAKELTGELLPVAAAEGADGDAGEDPARTGPARDGAGSGEGRDVDGDTVAIGGAVLAIALAVWLGLRGRRKHAR
ncbi:hypothetical protein JJV70_04355 [Streptomyces sp. JJ66]|uniref:esterase-like activity of phytase family protein n=1 Tax=Streptomyces sp. JJ66 TaxID=2803843 RepID=UPI001C578DFE|nr:esterase-like activity of phytase family protein [Streptomyces sp. JJ66]MBW1601347.1 hypothetical protein [Streptomyces sp. JJ66]